MLHRLEQKWTYQNTEDGNGIGYGRSMNASRMRGDGYTGIINGNGGGMGVDQNRLNWVLVFSTLDTIDLLTRLAAKQALTKP